MQLRPQYNNLLASKPLFAKAKKWHKKDIFFWGVIALFLILIGVYTGYVIPQQRINQVEGAISKLKNIAEQYHQQTLSILNKAGVYIEAFKDAKIEEIPSLAQTYQLERLRSRRNNTIQNRDEQLDPFSSSSGKGQALKIADIANLLAKESAAIIANFPNFARKREQFLVVLKQWEAAQIIINRPENQAMIKDAEQTQLQETFQIDNRTFSRIAMGFPEPPIRLESAELELALSVQRPHLKPSIIAKQALFDAVKEVERSQAMVAEAQTFFDQLKNQWKLIFPKKEEPASPANQPSSTTLPSSNSPKVNANPSNQTTPAVVVSPEQQRREAETLRIEAERRAAEEKRLQEQRRREEEQRRANEALCRSGLSSNCPGK